MKKTPPTADLLELARLIKTGNQQTIANLLMIYQSEIDREIRYSELPKQKQEELKEMLVLNVLEAAHYFDETVEDTAMTSQENEAYRQEKRRKG